MYSTYQDYEKSEKGQKHKFMRSGLGLGHGLRWNTLKHTSKHTKHSRKNTIHHITKHAKIQKNMTYTGEELRDVYAFPWWRFTGLHMCGGT